MVNTRRSTCTGSSPGATSILEGANVGGWSSTAKTSIGNVMYDVRAVVSLASRASVTGTVTDAGPA